MAATKFMIDLGAQIDVRVLALLDHNASPDAKIRIQVSTAANFTQDLYDSGWQPFWLPHHPQGGLPWGHPSFWDGGSCPAEDLAQFPKCRYFQLTQDYSIVARYVLVWIDDQTNPAGHFELSRCVVAPAWQPPVNMAYGAKMGWDDSATTVSTSKGGVDHFGIAPKRRVCNFTLEAPTAVGVSWFMEMQRKLGVSQELFFVYDPDDATMLEQTRSFLATRKDLSPLELPYNDRSTDSFQLREKL